MFLFQRVKASGFTFIEMMVTLAILGVLASATFPLIKLSEKRSKEQELRIALRQIRTAIDNYKKAVDEGFILRNTMDSGYPTNLEVLVNGIENAKDPQRSQLYFLRKLPRDPLASEAGSPAQTWGKRSYMSPPDQPSEGRDVFDIYSLNQGVGINGIPYTEW